MRIFKVLAKIIGGILLASLIAFLFGAVVQWLWNCLMPGLFHLPVISFWQAAGLVLLSRLLVGNIGSHNRHGAHGCCGDKGKEACCCGRGKGHWARWCASHKSKDCCETEGQDRAES